jgi:Ca2+-binding RTX toxin-like protein
MSDANIHATTDARPWPKFVQTDGSDAANRFNGTAASETVFGTGESDVVYGNGGNDTLYGGGSQDWWQCGR